MAYPFDPSTHYPIPKDRLNGRSAEMAFADALYYLAATEGWDFATLPAARAVDLNFQQVSQLTGLDQQTITQEVDTAVLRGWLKYSDIGDRAYQQVYLVNYAPLANGAGIRKPLDYVRHSWLHTMYKMSDSYLPQRVLNLIWLMRFGPEPREVSVDELRRRAADNARPISRSRIYRTLDLLEQLRIVQPQAGQYQLDRDCFAQPAPDPSQVQSRWCQTRLRTDPRFLQFAERDAARAQLALDIIVAGQFDPERDLEAIFHDLQWVGESVDLLLKLARRRHKNANSSNWKALWKNYLHHRQTELAPQGHLHSAEVILRFDQHALRTAWLDLGDVAAEQVWNVWFHAQLRSTLSARQGTRNQPERPEALASLRWQEEEVLSLNLRLGQKTHQPLTLVAPNSQVPVLLKLMSILPQPLPGAWLEAWLEADFRHAS